MKETIQAIYRHLKPKAYFFFDLPDIMFFNSGGFITPSSKDLNRNVKLTKKTDNIYIYYEICSGVMGGQPFKYSDEFLIRYWELDFIEDLLQQEGLQLIEKHFPQFNFTGSTYQLYQKK